MIDQASELRQLVRCRANPPVEAARTRPSLIAVTGGKGGVGTTTVAIHLAMALARQSDTNKDTNKGVGSLYFGETTGNPLSLGKQRLPTPLFASRVLLVDADPDRRDVAAFCGLSPGCDLADLAIASRPLGDVAVAGPGGIQVIAGATPATTGDAPIERFHRRWIAAVRDAAESFDYIVVDTGNGSSRSVKMLWEAAELVLLVTTPELPSILDAYASVKTLADRAAPPPVHTLVNQVDEPAAAYDVHGRLARAVWRFLGFHLDSAGRVAACPESLAVEPSGEPPAEAASPLASDFDQLARVVRAALHESVGRRTTTIQTDPGGEKDHLETSESPMETNEDVRWAVPTATT